jgi:squalene-hopene/tetraprenyl-beta-curcumene cyclase
MSIQLALLALSLLAPIASSSPQGAPPVANEKKAAEPVELDLGQPIDGALRWMRGRQDRTDGSYGKSVETTAWVLRAMIVSPRKYQRVDGPFVARALDWLVSRQQADGSIHDEGASKADVLRQTSLAAGALSLHADGTTQPAISKALIFVAKGSGESTTIEPGWGDAPLPEAKEALRAEMQAVLAKRAAEGSWNGDVRETARAAVLLSRAQPVLKPAAKPSAAAKSLPKVEKVDRERATASLLRGAQFLAAAAENGKYGAPGKPDAGITAMAISALETVPAPRPKEVQSVIDSGLAWLLMLQKDDGSIHDGKLANYTTSAAIMALARAGKAEFAPAIEKAQKFLLALQIDEGEDYSPDNPYYGGIGYGSSERPDLSNLQMALEALTASGLEKDNPAFKRALTFLERCQNRSESNDVRIRDGERTIVPGDDGGAAYLPGQSMAGYVETADGKKIPRSYGSMSYALLKGFIFAGLPKDDPRMKACFDWLRGNYTLDVNPGFEGSSDPAAAYQGLFYYFHTMAKALDLYGEETIVDAQDVPHEWRAELAGRIVAMQRKADGAWINENSPRWYEGNPILATAYALLTLDLALPPAGK